MTLEELGTKVGEPLGISDWHELSQRTIDEFGRVTLDEQWIHTDPARAASGPFGGTIAHGFLTLSLCPKILEECVTVEGIGMAVNYGLDKVRFPSPVLAGGRVRGHVTLEDFKARPDGGQAVMRVAVESDGSEKPVCVALVVTRFVV